MKGMMIVERLKSLRIKKASLGMWREVRKEVLKDGDSVKYLGKSKLKIKKNKINLKKKWDCRVRLYWSVMKT